MNRNVNYLYKHSAGLLTDYFILSMVSPPPPPPHILRACSHDKDLDNRAHSPTQLKFIPTWRLYPTIRCWFDHFQDGA